MMAEHAFHVTDEHKTILTNKLKNIGIFDSQNVLIISHKTDTIDCEKNIYLARACFNDELCFK